MLSASDFATPDCYPGTRVARRKEFKVCRTLAQPSPDIGAFSPNGSGIRRLHQMLSQLCGVEKDPDCVRRDTTLLRICMNRTAREAAPMKQSTSLGERIRTKTLHGRQFTWHHAGQTVVSTFSVARVTEHASHPLFRNTISQSAAHQLVKFDPWCTFVIDGPLGGCLVQ